MRHDELVLGCVGAALASSISILLALQFLVPAELRDATMPVATAAVALLFTGFGVLATRLLLDLRRSGRRSEQMAQTLGRERREAEDGNLAKSAFIADVGERMRGPLNSVLELLELLNDTGLVRTQREYVAVAIRSTENLLALVNDVQDYSKLEFSRLDIEEEDFSPAELMDDVIMLLAPRASEAGNVINRHVAVDLAPWLRGDPMRIRQILLNLVGNAVKFTNAGVIDVRLSSHATPDGAVMLEGEVADTGVGLTPEDVNRLFMRFSPADASPIRRFAGGGMGVAICRRLCELMGGEISVRSTPGAGSVFTFRVRCAVDALPPSAPEGDNRRHAAAPVADAPMRVLVVDDVATNRMLLGALLRKEGHEPYFANDGREAVRALVRDSFDLVLMDVQMPVLDGISAAQAIRSLDDDVASATPIIAVTANRDADDRDRYFAAGMNGYLGKPVRRGALLETLARFTPKPAGGEKHFSSAGVAVAAPFQSLLAAQAINDEDGELLDMEQTETLVTVLGASDWRDCVDSFAESGRAQIEAAAAIADEGGSPKIPAHTLKGMAVNVGARRLADVARRLEKCPPEEAGELIALLPELLERSVKALRAAGEAGAGDDD
jgi:two-component system, sensor histidine kinase